MNNARHQEAGEPVLRLLCYVLRHNPTPFRIRVDQEGWASAEQVLNAIRVRHRRLCLWRPWKHRELKHFVAKHHGRFELRGNLLRARYGHSLLVVLGVVRTPPPVLFHGTADYYLNAIRMLGLRAYKRRFVHLTSEYSYAHDVAEAKDGTPTTLTVRASEAAELGGIMFRQATEHVWLVPSLPHAFVDFPHRKLSC